jgi:5-methylcytosine-specific restriction protein A
VPSPVQSRKVQDARYRAAHRRERNAKKRIWASRHPGLVRANHKRWRDKHPEVNRAKASAWAKQHPGRANANKARHRDAMRTPPCPKVAAFYEFVRSAPRLRCYWCGKVTAKKRRQVDHIIPLARGGRHERSNLCCSCATCNNRKHAKTREEFTGQRELCL